ncbi:MAG: tetratricopeptide repeat protein [Xanthomonadales bacterium]|nr:tetratricopeptide repeat protein [Xanthomonadales bacterium]
MSFFEELKRRNVIRVAIAYGVGAWLLLQLTDVLVDLLGLPDTAGKYVILFLVIGFPLALFFAWAFEMTPEGIRREADVDRSESIVHDTGRKLDRSIIAVLALAVVFFVYDKFSAPEDVGSGSVSQAGQVAGKQGSGVIEPDPIQTPSEPSIAVLPFLNISNDPEQEYFSDGIAEELLNLLVRVDGLKVASRTSSFVYKGENLNIPAIAEELKVNHILEGSVRKAGNRVRITAQLIDTSDDRHLWSDTFDRELDDIFAIQDEIANSIVDALKNELGIGLASVTVEAATGNLDAYELYLKGRGLFIARQNLDISTTVLRKAVELDPEFAEAWETLAAAESVSASWLAGDGIDHHALAQAAANKALELDPELSMAYAVLSQTPTDEWDHLNAVGLLDTAILNDPKNATAYLWRGINLIELGHFEHAIASFETCLAIDPGYLNCKQHMSVAYLSWGKTEQARRIFEETIEENFHSVDDVFVSHYLKRGDRLVAFLLGNTSVFGDYAPIQDWIEAIDNPEQNHNARIARWERWAENQGYPFCNLTGVFVALRVDRCYSEIFSGGFKSIWHPDAAYFKNSPEFKELVTLYAMPYWREHGFPPQCTDLGDGDFECT